MATAYGDTALMQAAERAGVDVFLHKPVSPSTLHDAALQARAALFWGWLVLGGHLLSPEQNFLALALIGWMPLASTPRASRQSLAPSRLLASAAA